MFTLLHEQLNGRTTGRGPLMAARNTPRRCSVMTTSFVIGEVFAESCAFK